MCAIEWSYPKVDGDQILKRYLEYSSNYVHFQNLNAKFKMGVNDKVKTDLDLHKWSNLGMGVYAVNRSYPKVDVGQI